MDNKLISLNGKIFAQIGGVVKKTPTQINILQNPTITEAEGTAEPLELSKIIKNLNISDIIVNKDGNSLSEGYHYNLSNLNTKFPIVTFTANAVLTSESILTIEIIKSGYIVNSKQPIEIINQISGLMYGLLYNWYAINDVNFTPNNWKIPTTEEFDILFSYADNQQHINILKSSVGWPNGYNGYDGFGFRGLPAGSRETSFHDLGLFSNWWTSSMILTSPLRRTFVWNEPMVQSYGSYKYNGNSVRLLWSGTGTPPATITDYDGNIYNVLQIGTQYWLNKNWKCTHLKNGTLIPNVTNQSTWNSLLTGACCAYDNDNSKV